MLKELPVYHSNSSFYSPKPATQLQVGDEVIGKRDGAKYTVIKSFNRGAVAGRPRLILSSQNLGEIEFDTAYDGETTFLCKTVK